LAPPPPTYELLCRVASVPNSGQIRNRSYGVQFRHFMKLGITADRKPSLDAMWRAYRAAISGIEDESDWARVVTTTYGYDAFGARVYQIASTTATTTYPFKFFSVASSTRSGTNYSTTTEYVFNGDTLLATVDQAFRNGAATGSPKRATSIPITSAPPTSSPTRAAQSFRHSITSRMARRESARTSEERTLRESTLDNSQISQIWIT
jgi:hypothetical protein